jgi:hypothetical protein
MRYPAVSLDSRILRRLAALVLVPLVASACGGDSDTEMSATPEDVDTSSEAVVTDRERAAFNTPANGQLTEEQVANYLKVSLLQFDLIRKESQGLHERVARMEEREKKGGVIAGIRNVADAGRLIMNAADVLGGSYVRSARTLGLNPAEMEWVQQQMTETAGYFAAAQMQQMSREGVEQIRAQARDMEARRAAGEEVYLSEDDIRQMLTQADEMEREFEANIDQSARRNAEVLRRARPNVTDAMWMQLGWHGGGLFAWAGLSNPQDTTAQRQLDDYRRIFEDALANRVSAGMEADPDGN